MPHTHSQHNRGHSPVRQSHLARWKVPAVFFAYYMFGAVVAVVAANCARSPMAPVQCNYRTLDSGATYRVVLIVRNPMRTPCLDTMTGRVR